MKYQAKISKWRLNYFRNIKHHFQNISIHAIPQIFLSNSWFEFLFWITVTACGLYYFLVLLNDNLISFHNKPLVKTIDTVAYPTASLPFPAVTVCNYNVVYQPKADEIAELLIKHGLEESLVKDFFSKLEFLQEPEMFDPYPYRKVYDALWQIGYSNNTQFMRDIAQPCSTLLNLCIWSTQVINCSLLFTQSKADLGFCCSFNSDIFPLDSGQHQEYFTNAGSEYGLFVEFNMTFAHYVSPTGVHTGLVIYVHGKNAYPAETSFFALLEPGQEVSMKMIPHIYGAETDIRNVKPSVRKCWFHDEGSAIFNTSYYSFETCMHMCKTVTIGKLCNCVPYSHLGYVHWNSCSLMNIPCLVDNEDAYTNLYTRVNYNEKVKDKPICNCLPSCTGVNYEGTLESLTYKNSHGDRLVNTSSVEIFNQHNWCKKYTVRRAIHLDQLIALVGGLFSLCFGGSILSIVEFTFCFIKSCFIKNERTKNSVKKKKAIFQSRLYWDELKIYKIPRRKKQNVRYPIDWNNFLN